MKSLLRRKLSIQTKQAFHYQQRLSLSTKHEQSTSQREQQCMDLEDKFGAHNYHPIPVVISEGKGVNVWDVNGKKYYDFLSAYSALNQGHCHPKIIESLKQQCDKLTLTSRAFYNDSLGEFSEYVTSYFNYKRVLPMNSGVEACESSLKIARRWAYEIKKVPQNQARIVFAENNFWGRSIGAISSSTDPDAYNNYGPFVPNFDIIPYNDINALQKILEENHENIAAFMCEPIQGEAGVVIPNDDYLVNVRRLCDKYNVLWIADEVQTGMGRTGKRLCVDHYFGDCDANGVHSGPDLVTMGKALSGGVLPVSCVVSKTDEIMDVLTPGTHGSTYGGNPLACKVAITALEVLREEKMSENSMEMGKYLLNGLKEFEKEFDIVNVTRGKGLFCAMEIDSKKGGVNAWEVCMKLMKNGILAKPTHDHIIRLSPPLVINKTQIEECLGIIRKTLLEI